MYRIFSSRLWKTAAISLSLVFSSLIAAPAVQAAGNAVVSITAPSQPVTPGTQFTVTVGIQPNNAIAGAQFDLSFNPAVATISSVIEGNLFKQGGASTYFSPGAINNTAGTLTGVTGVIITPGQTVSTSGTLASITFTATSTKGTSSLNLSNVVVGDINAQALGTTLSNGSVITDRAPVLNSIGSKSVALNSNLAFTISGSDGDGDTLTYSASNLPSGASFNASTRAFSWTPGSGQGGTYTGIHFQVTDGTLTASEDITITVGKATPAFSNLSAPSISYGTSSTSLGGTLKAGSLVPTGSVSITLNGITQSAALNGSGNFSSSFNTAALSVGGSPYTINYSYAGDASFNATSDTSKSLTVNSLAATVTLTNLTQTYDGAAKTVTATTSPSGLTVAITYNGSATAPTNAGAYAVVATVTSANYSGSSSGTFTISKASPAFSSLSSPSINYGAASTSLGGKLKAGTLVPTGSVSVTLNGVAQSASLDGSGNFSSVFNTSALPASGSPYTISYSYAGSANFNTASDTSKTLTVTAVFAAWDTNQDNAVNVLDMSIVGQHWSETGTAGWIAADVNKDGVISALDMILIGQHWTG